MEDSPPLQRMLCEALEEEYATLSALDGLVGYRLALAHEPDLIVLDVGLPLMDGRTVLRSVRANPRLSQVPVLVVTGCADDALNLELLAEGAQDLLRKPFSLAELEARVRNLVASKRTLDTLNATIGQHETDLVKLATRVAEQQRELQNTLDKLDRARRVAEQANRMKSNFLRMMSHELKTPVAAIQLHMRLIETGAAQGPSSELQDGIVRMGRSSRRLLHLVDTFLEWSRADQACTELALGEVSLQEVAEDVASELRGYALQKGLRVEVDPPDPALPLLTTDRKIVRLLTVHLVYRAIQMSRSGAVTLRVHQAGDSQYIGIRDTAPPLSPEQQLEAFDEQPDPSDIGRRAGAGSGLGLRVARDIAHAVAGKLTLEVDPLGGNLWTLSLQPLMRKRRPAQDASFLVNGTD